MTSHHSHLGRLLTGWVLEHRAAFLEASLGPRIDFFHPKTYSERRMDSAQVTTLHLTWLRAPSPIGLFSLPLCTSKQTPLLGPPSFLKIFTLQVPYTWSLFSGKYMEIVPTPTVATMRSPA